MDEQPVGAPGGPSAVSPSGTFPGLTPVSREVARLEAEAWELRQIRAWLHQTCWWSRPLEGSGEVLQALQVLRQSGRLGAENPEEKKEGE